VGFGAADVCDGSEGASCVGGLEEEPRDGVGVGRGGCGEELAPDGGAVREGPVGTGGVGAPFCEAFEELRLGGGEDPGRAGGGLLAGIWTPSPRSVRRGLVLGGGVVESVCAAAMADRPTSRIALGRIMTSTVPHRSARTCHPRRG